MKPLILLFSLCLIFTFALPDISFAQDAVTPNINADGTVKAGSGFIPCEGTQCQACHFIVLGNTIIKWLIGMIFIFFAFLAVAAGFKLVTSGGNPSAKQSAKQSFTNAFIGLAIVLAAWLIVDTLMRGLLKDGGNEVNGYGPWMQVKCAENAQSNATTTANFWPEAVVHPVPDGSRGLANTAAAGELSQAQISALASLSAPDDKVAAAAQSMGLDARQIKNLQALMRVESSGCKNNISPVGAVGCLQVMPATARNYVPALKGKSDAEVREWLLNPDNNISVGVRVYSDLYKAYSGNETMVFAAYNGGPGANSPSKDCPGQVRWQCVWDSPGCYGTSNTNCARNTGYNETRAYVKKIPAVAAGLGG